MSKFKWKDYMSPQSKIMYSDLEGRVSFRFIDHMKETFLTVSSWLLLSIPIIQPDIPLYSTMSLITVYVICGISLILIFHRKTIEHIILMSLVPTEAITSFNIRMAGYFAIMAHLEYYLGATIILVSSYFISVMRYKAIEHFKT